MASLESVFNHLVLPPKLPGKQDPDIEGAGDSILTRLVRACDTLERLSGQEYVEIWSAVSHCLQVCRDVNSGRLERRSLLKAFRHLRPNQQLILHVVEQNAAILIRRPVSDGPEVVVFEAFEASPLSEHVLAAEDALVWDFPGRAVKIPLEEFLRDSFQQNLAEFLEKASIECLPRFKAHSSKAGVSVIEARDAADPALVTQMLMPLLEAIGSPACVETLRKRVRDDVNIDDTELPWRRLPFWLILRVATQRQLCFAFGNETGRACYKFLICTMLAQLLEDSVGQLAPELVITLRSKLCRRLAKLEAEKENTSTQAATCLEQLFTSTGPFFKRIIEAATTEVETAWTNWKRTRIRPVPRLPTHAAAADQRLRLPNSGKYLDGILRLSFEQRPGFKSPHAGGAIGGDSLQQIRNFTDRYFELTKRESSIESEQSEVPLTKNDQARCLDLANSITAYFDAVGGAYDSNPEQMSMFILNVFDLWVRLDRCAIIDCPLLRKYHPVFSPELLDVLHLPNLSSMRRLQHIQTYLRNRSQSCQLVDLSIFSEPNKDCFAAKYLEQSTELQDMLGQIEKDQTKSRDAKELEWEIACERYDELSLKISEGTCVCTFNPDGSRDVRGCKKCWQWRSRKRMKIGVHEDMLPIESHRKAALVFELGIPSYLAAYRNVTWRILRDLGHPSKPPAASPPPVALLSDLETRRYGHGKPPAHGLSLASAKKCFLQTHFKAVQMKVNLPKVLLPLGADFSYYDLDSGIWVNRLDKPLTLQHLCGIHVPRSLEVSVMPPAEHPPPDTTGPSSYEIVANQTQCPQEMSVHEFTAYQRLLSGKTLRWPTMLVELGSSNLNFSCEDTMHIVGQLAIQAGPQNKAGGVLREIHSVFEEDMFCQRLAEQISKRLRNITSNWREVHCMETLISLSLRLFSLTLGAHRRSAENLLQIARRATLDWTLRLRHEVRTAAEAHAAKRAAMYGFQAALLCRRTFSIFVGLSCTLDDDDLSSFFQSSMALQENLLIDLDQLPQNLKAMLIRDTKMAYLLQPLIRKSAQLHIKSLEDAITTSWSESSRSVRSKFSPWRFLETPNDGWIASTVTTATTQFSYKLEVHYNLVEGHLLVDGKPSGRLPLSIRESDDVKELFGEQHLVAYHSPLDDMSYKLPGCVNDHQIYFGVRGESVIIRAVTRNATLEYIPRRTFTQNGFDLPSSLLENCVHWLNLSSGCLEIRRKPVIWKKRMGDWVLDVRKRQAQRRDAFLVDPQSELFRNVAGMFRHFEVPERVTVSQPPMGTLFVELRDLELAFFVNQNSLLECRALRAEFDPNQDAGTLYGLESKIVLRDKQNKKQRSVIVPLGRPYWKRQGIHVAVQACGATEYGRFEIDDILGRLTCSPEPRLVYSRALFHSLTSFPLPDPLTGRTGTEEALHILRSGSSQPWTLLGDAPAAILGDLGKLSPRRVYYPEDMRRLQAVKWDEHLTVSVQHDGFEPLVRELLCKSNRLGAFVSNSDERVNVDAPSHLRRRGNFRRCVYQREGAGSERLLVGRDTTYLPRDRHMTLPQAANVFLIAKLIFKPQFRIRVRKCLRDILDDWKFIGGFRGPTPEPAFNCLSDVVEGEINEQWGNMVNFCRRTQDPHHLAFRLSLLSFAPSPNMEMIKVLAGFGCLDELKRLPVPPCPSFVDFGKRESPNLELLVGFIAPACLEWSPNGTKLGKKKAKQKEQHQILCKAEIDRCADFVMKQWPCPTPSANTFESPVVVFERAIERILPEWQRMYRNQQLSEYVDKVQGILDLYKCKKEKYAVAPFHAKLPALSGFRQIPAIPSLSRDLLMKRIFYTPIFSSGLHQQILASDLPSEPKFNFGEKKAREATELDEILNSFLKSPDDLRRQYGTDLKKSLAALQNVQRQPRPSSLRLSTVALYKSIEEARKAMKFHLDCIERALSGGDGRFQWLSLGNLWPCITPATILELLRSSAGNKFGRSMKEMLISYGVRITQVQHLERIKHAWLKRDHRRLYEEWVNCGHENWEPSEFPDWLLLEIDSNLLIRSEQVDVARAIIWPDSRSNSVLQMNMGKGKTSCIVPMAMAVLANKNQLARLIVPKPLLLQTAQTVQSRLGGLVGREVRHIPFSRRTPTTPAMLFLYSELHVEIFHSCGVILTTPEHILSYKLGGLQRLADGRIEQAQEMIGFQSRLTVTCRDVLDESDFTLAVKTQLIYPSGTPMQLDGNPYRWEIAQILLSLVDDSLASIQATFPRGIEIFRRQNGFPIIHFLQSDVEDELHRRIVAGICNGQVSHLRPAYSPASEHKIYIRRILSQKCLARGEVKRASRFFADREAAYKILLLLRGLILDGVLLLCLKKRWNVQYGLHPKRPPVAVPFEARGVPSEQAEFGHPDVSILLTCLAFYYSGLGLDQFGESLRYVAMSDDPAAEYDKWTHGCDTLPEALSHWSAINFDDQGQVEELWRHLRLDRAALDHYLNKFVFPVHAKYFNVKLQASGWDLPLLSDADYTTSHHSARTTGFSGTNDNKMMLPLSIRQDDLSSLLHTNAEVLTYLLQPRNREYHLAASFGGRRFTEQELLSGIAEMGIRILIDAGAYVLEMDNRSLARKWLDIDTKAKAAVFFGADNRAWVQYRGEKEKVPLLATPFSDSLENCLVYLDEAHTRGIDLHLPHQARGALTLALGQTKDHTVQAAMRLRQLGTTQSITFFAPPEVHQSILDVCKLRYKETINSHHVVRWLLEQTCRANEQLQSLYLAQGFDFCLRMNAQWQNINTLGHEAHRESLLKAIRQPERHSLEELYGESKEQPSSVSGTMVAFPKLEAFLQKLTLQRRTAGNRRRVIHTSALEEVEQEREVEFQVEEVRQVQKPNRYKALSFPGIHTSLVHFAKTGKLANGTKFKHAFDAAGETDIGLKHGVWGTGSRLFVSEQFMRTIDVREKRVVSDDFLRPVEWILWSPSTETAIVIIPEEAEALAPLSRRAQRQTKTYLIAYAAPVTRSMLHFNDMSFYTIPSFPDNYRVPTWLSVELGIFAGMLYLEFEDCLPLKTFLQVSSEARLLSVDAGEDDSGVMLTEDDCNGGLGKNPIAFLLEWLTLRRKTQDIMHTPMGYICKGRQLHKTHAFFSKRDANVQEITPGLEIKGGDGNDESGSEEEDYHMPIEWDSEGEGDDSVLAS